MGPEKLLPNLLFRPLTAERWGDFEELFGERGACGGCWCMWYRLSKKEFDAHKGEGNKRKMQALVDSGSVPGILAYYNGKAIGWCAVAPREEFPRLETGRVTKRVDDEPVWSVVCFFVAKPYRRQGVSTALLCAALERVRKRGGRIIEGYAVEPKKERMPDLFACPGPVDVYRKAGFEEVARWTPTRPVMRCYLEG